MPYLNYRIGAYEVEREPLDLKLVVVVIIIYNIMNVNDSVVVVMLIYTRICIPGVK